MNHDVLMEHLTRLTLTCIRDQINSLLDDRAGLWMLPAKTHL